MKLTKKGKMLAAILAIAFVVYNIIFFILCGFTGHGATFWLSWAFMMIAFGSMATIGCILGRQGLFLRDWLFGYPIIKHSTIYLILEFLLSTVFVVFDKSVPWGWAFAAQLLIFGVYLVFAISCFMAKETIKEVKTKVSDKTRFIKLLRTDAEMLVEKCDDPALKEQCRKFAESVRYSDPMSDEALFELEKELAYTVSQCDQAIVARDYIQAEQLCSKASLLLTERNRKCKALK